MTEREKIANENLQKIAKFAKENLPENFGFVVLAFDFNKRGDMLYVSNADRNDVAKAMKEFTEKVNDNNFGKHDKHDGKTWYDIEELMKMELDNEMSIWCLNTHNMSDFLTTMGDIRLAVMHKGNAELKVYQFAIVGKGEK